MKTSLLFLSTLLLSFSASAQLPNTVVSNGYTFVKEWTNEFDADASGWHMGDWTFADNACEFGAQGLVFDQSKLNISISEKTSGDMGSAPAKPYWSGEYWQEDKNLYGRYVVNMKPNTPAGVVTSFFLMNIEWNSDYSQALEWSEIDIEFAGNTDHVQFTLHWIDANHVKQMDPHTVTLSSPINDSYHQWIIEWTPTYIKYYLDGTLLFTFDDPVKLAEQARPQEIHMNHWVSTATGWVGAFDEANLPVTTSYDQLTYYRLDQPTSNQSSTGEDAMVWFDTAHRQLVINPSVKSGEYVILNSLGAVVQKGTATGAVIRLNDNLATGSYVVQIKSEKGMLTEKIMLP